VFLVLLKTNQYKKKTIGKKMANAKELKNIFYFTNYTNYHELGELGG
jgi:hypothetical protein